MKSLILTAAVCWSAITNAQQNVASGDVVQIGDFQYVVLSKGDFERMKVKVDDLAAKWERMNDTEAGRVALHGARQQTIITNEAVQAVYADGYVRIETPKKARPRIVERPVEMPKRKVAPEALQRIREKRRRAAATTNEVSVTIGG